MIPVRPSTAAAIESKQWEFIPRLEWAPAGSTDWEPLDLVSWNITASRTQQTRFSLQARLDRSTLAGPRGLHAFGCGLRAFIGVKPIRSSVEWLAAGVYMATSVSDDESSGVSLQGLSDEVEIQGSDFPHPRTFPSQPSMTYRQQAERLIREVRPEAQINWSTSLTSAYDRMPSVTVDRDRWGLLYGRNDSISIGNALGADVYCDRHGAFTFQPIPTLQDTTPVAHLYRDTFVVSRTRAWNRNNVSNLVVATGQAADGQTSIGPAYRWVTDPGSLLYAGPDPVNRPDLAGPYGVKPYFYNSPLLTTYRQALTAAAGMLVNVSGFNTSLVMTVAADPRLEVGDPVWVDDSDGRPVLCMLDEVSYGDAGVTALTVRSANGISGGN